MAKVAFKLSTMGAETFIYQQSQSRKIALNCPPCLDKCSNISPLKWLNLHLNLFTMFEEIFKYKYSTMAKIALKLSTMVGEIFKYKNSKKWPKLHLNRLLWFENFSNISTLKCVKLHVNCLLCFEKFSNTSIVK